MKLKNIVFIMTDQQRLDYVGYSGKSNFKTPNIDRIAESIGFTNCQTVNPVCTPARTALLSGRYPHQIGTLAMSGDLSRQIPTYTKALQKKGYFTAGIGKFHFLQTWDWNTKRGKGIPLNTIKDDIKDYGFDVIWESSGKQLATKNYCDYCAYLDKKGKLDSYRDFVESAGQNSKYAKDLKKEPEYWPFRTEDYVDVIIGDKIVETIQHAPKSRPFFIYGSFCSPHKPYDPPKEYLDLIPHEEKDDFILYNGEILTDDIKDKLYKQRRSAKAMVKLVDDQIGKIFHILEKKDLLKDTVILFTSDHGDMLGDHGRMEKMVPWKQSCTVPAAIRHPDYLNKIVNSSPIEIIDFTATILDIAGLNPIHSLSKDWPAFNNIIPCISLLPLIKEQKESIRDFSFTEFNNEWEMIQTDNFKYIIYFNDFINITEELYDLKSDPNEQVNIIDDKRYKEEIISCRNRRIILKDKTPAAQTSWAPLIK